MSGLISSNRARAVVHAFLAERLSDSESDGQPGQRERVGSDSDSDEESAQVLSRAPRPARLGLGAVFNPTAHKPELSEVDRRLIGRVRAEQSREAARLADGENRQPSVESSDDEHDPDSRSAKLQGKRSKRQPRTVSPTLPIVQPTLRVPTEPTSHVIAAGPDQRTTPVFEVSAQATVQSEASRTFERTDRRTQGIGRPDSNEAVNLPIRKNKSKTRSRRKNLKRDTRPKDKLPPHLTPETLRARLVKGNATRSSGSAPWFEDRSLLPPPSRTPDGS